MRRLVVHDLILSGSAPTLVPDGGPVAGVCSGPGAEVVAPRRWLHGVGTEAQVESTEAWVALQEAVDLGLQAVSCRRRLRLRGQVHVPVKGLHQG